MISWFLHHLLHVTSITVSTSHHKIKVDTSEFFARSTFICRDKEKGDVFFWKSTGFCWYTGDINEGNEVSEWIWLVSLITEVWDFLEYVFVGNRTWRYFLKDEEFTEGPPWCSAELECEGAVKEFGTANHSSLVLSPTVISVFEKWRLHTYCLDNVLACSAPQGMPSVPALSWALCKNGTRKYKNETVIPMISVLYYILTARWTPHVTPTNQCVLCLLQIIVQILIYSDSNIKHLLKRWTWTNSSPSYDVSYKYTMWILLFNVQYTVHTRYWVMYIQLTR